MSQNRNVILPLIYGSLEANLTHWNPAVIGLTKNVRDMFMEMDKELFEECGAKHQREQVPACCNALLPISSHLWLPIPPTL